MPASPNRPTPSQLRALARTDRRLAAALRRVGPFPGYPDAVQGGHTHFSYLARSIVFQQLAGKAAATIYGRVAALTPGRSFPRAPEVLALPDKPLRGAGLSANKLASLRDLAARVEDGRLKLHSIGRVDDEEIIERLVTVRGIGRWTAQMFLLFRLGRLDIMPTADLGVQEGLRRLDELDERPSPDELGDRAQAWAPLRSVAAWTLWRLTDD